jgi:hypothetical protein
MNTISFGGNRQMRTSFLTVLAAALFAAGCAVDATKLACNSSTECPSGYHCDMSALKCASGAPSGNPTLSSFAWDKTLVQPGDHATLTFTVSEPIDAAGFPPEVAAHGITLGALTAVTTGAAATYTMAVNMPAACDGAGNNPTDDAAIALSLAFTASGNRTGSGPIGSVTCTVAKTLAATASKVRLVKQPYPDGTVRTTISADKGAISATPGFAGVSLVASSGGTVVGSAAARSDGSAALLELAGAPTQVTLSVVDRTGRSVAVPGYAQRVVMSLSGKDVAGNVNPLTAYDTGSVSASTYVPQSWVASGTGPDGGTIQELAQSMAQLSDGGISVPTSYQAFGYEDGIRGFTQVPPMPDQDGGTAIGWEPIAVASTTTTPAVVPPARVGHALTRAYGGVTSTTNTNFAAAMFGGVDQANAFVDVQGSFYGLNPNAGGIWGVVLPATQQPFVGTNTGPYATRFWQTTSVDQAAGPYLGVDNPVSRANAAIGSGYEGSTTCCTDYAYYINRFLLAGGNTTSTTVATNKIYAWGDRYHITSGGATLRQYTGWWDITAETGVGLPFANAGMAYAALPAVSIPTTLGSGGQFTPGMMLIGGNNNTQFSNDANGCLTLAALYQSPNHPQYQVASCTDGNWASSTGRIGFRAGASLAASDNSDGSFYLFGGNQTASSTPAFNGFKNDIWQGVMVMSCTGPTTGVLPPCPAGYTAVRTPVWTQLTIAGTPPVGRTGASLVFGDSRRLVVYGGVSAAGTVLSDAWEVDLNVASPAWRQITLDASPALAPVPRTRPAALGVGQVTLVGGLTTGAGATVMGDAWILSKTAPGRVLVKAPTGISNPAAATNLALTLTVAPATPFPFLYIWDGSTWRFISRPTTVPTVVSLQNPTNYLQPDGSVYLMFVSTTRNRPGSVFTTSVASFDSLSVSLDFQ